MARFNTTERKFSKGDHEVARILRGEIRHVAEQVDILFRHHAGVANNLNARISELEEARLSFRLRVLWHRVSSVYCNAVGRTK